MPAKPKKPRPKPPITDGYDRHAHPKHDRKIKQTEQPLFLRRPEPRTDIPLMGRLPEHLRREKILPPRPPLRRRDT